MRKRIALFLFCLSLSCPWAQDEDKDFQIRNTGYFIWDLGYLNEAQHGSDGAIYKSVPFGHLMGGLVLQVKPNDRLTLTLNPELKNYIPFPIKPGESGGESQFRPKWMMYLEEAKAHWKLGDPGKPNWDLGVGYMIYKENLDTKIFGDYLFRSWIYPGVLFTKFNYPQAQIFGLRLGNRLGDNFKHNAFLLSEVKYYPYFDLSLAYTATYSAGNMFEVGAGVNFRSLMPIRPSLTTPKGLVGSHHNSYTHIPYQTATPVVEAGGATKFVTIREAASGADSTDIIITYADTTQAPKTYKVKGKGASMYGEQSIEDLEISQGKVYPNLGGTVSHYSYAGTIMTGRAALNTLGFMEINPLGRDALKVYVEAAVLGWKNYPGFYENRRERIPIMAGINLPTFNLLEYLTFETEYYPSKIFPSMYYRSNYNVPQPGIYKSNGKWQGEERFTLDDWKWGFAARKSIKGFAVLAQVGTDHTKLLDYSGLDYDDNLTRPSQWYVQVRFLGGVF